MIAHPGEGVGRAVAASSTAALLDSLVELGEYDQASALLVDPWWDGRLSAMPCHYLLLFSRGKLRLATGDAGRASADFRECGRLAREWGLTNPGALPWRSYAAVAAAVLGHGAVGLDLARAEVELARRAGNRGALGAALVAEAVLGGCETNLMEAAELLGGRDVGWADGGRLAGALRLLRRCGRRVLAGGLGALAQTPANRFGATLRHAGLSAHECRLIDMAVAGRTNGEIAQRFTVSRRAIEFHFTQIYRKLGITRRAQLHRMAPTLTGQTAVPSPNFGR